MSRLRPGSKRSVQINDNLVYLPQARDAAARAGQRVHGAVLPALRALLPPRGAPAAPPAQAHRRRQRVRALLRLRKVLPARVAAQGTPHDGTSKSHVGLTPEISLSYICQFPGKFIIT